MANWKDKVATQTEDGETIVVGRPAFVASFCSYGGFRDSALPILEGWLDLVPKKTLLLYTHHETTSYRKLTPKALAKVKAHLKPNDLDKDRSRRHYLFTSAEKGGRWDECHAYSLELSAHAVGTSFAYLTFPVDYVDTRGTDFVLEWLRSWVEQMVFPHALAGFGYEVGWSSELEQEAMPVMIRTGLRFHGVQVWDRDTANDVGMIVNGKQVYTPDELKSLSTAAWLTYLSEGMLSHLGQGALDRLESGVAQHRCKTGILLQAGPAPDAADGNRRGPAWKLLKSVNDLIRPIRRGQWSTTNMFDIDPDRANGWFARMD